MSDGKFNDGGPAFPSVQPEHLMADQCCWGMTLRDYFAARALNGLLADDSRVWLEMEDYRVAHAAYRFADAMLKARTQ